MRARTLGIPVLLASLLAGCAVVATHDEYGTYRQVRMADNDRDRLLAMHRYVTEHPAGYWIEEVQEMRRAKEDEVWNASYTSREGLEWYLQIYPDGQYVDQARPRLAALQTVRSRQDEEEERQRELERQRRQELLEQRRTWVTRAMQFWTRTMVGIRNYGSSIQRIARGNEEFNRAFGQQPAPQCTADYCIKHYGQVYHIPVPGATRIDRHIDVYLRLLFDRGRMNRAELLLPNKGFSRWYEMENQTVVTDEDPEQRTMAINWALDRIQPIIQEVASGAERIDFIPEPVDPLQVQAEAEDTEEAPTAPDETPEEQQARPEPQPMPEQTEEAPEEGSLDALLAEAAGADQQQQQQPVEPQQTDEPETMVLPVNLLAYRYRNLRVVVFAAGEDDYGNAYDGLFIERIRD
ncbi:MAG: hypothetical protein VYE22_15885 [Myxococcota bacterium]|nr:hypothetical protein [Myxococcota bacterium]